MIRTLTLAALSAAALSFPLAASAGPKGCPPGLAKKSVACMPPGHARTIAPRRDDDRVVYERHRHLYRVGERLDGDYILIRDPDRYGLSRGYTYYRQNDYIYRVDPETRKVMNVIGAISALLD